MVSSQMRGASPPVAEFSHQIVIGDSRDMKEVDSESIHLVVTSPPYPMIEMWDDLFRRMGCESYDEMHAYLSKTWEECFRVLVDGGIACINIGDATRKLDGLFRLFPNHSKVIEYCERMGFTTLPYILWKKPTNKPNSFLGSGFLPPNAYITLDCEFILIFRKGSLRKFKPNHHIRYESQYTKQERDTWFSQIWNIKGEKQSGFASYPLEVPHRLIRMFSVIGDTVLDPFLGTGTTIKAARELKRNSVGYEIDESVIPVIKRELDYQQTTLSSQHGVKFLRRS